MKTVCMVSGASRMDGLEVSVRGCLDDKACKETMMMM